MNIQLDKLNRELNNLRKQWNTAKEVFQRSGSDGAFLTAQSAYKKMEKKQKEIINYMLQSK